MSSEVLGPKVAFCNYLPEYENHCNIYCFPSTRPDQQGRCTLLTNELKNLKHSGSILVVPHLPGYQCCYSAQKVNRCTHFCLKIGAKLVQNNDKIGAKIGATPPFHSRLAVVVGARPLGLPFQ